MDIILFLTVVGTGLTVISFMHTIIKNLKDDVNRNIEKLETNMNRRFESMDNKIISLETKFENKINSLEERMFWMATGRKLDDVILEERMKKSSNE